MRGDRLWWALAAGLGLVAVAAGAFGAHGLEAAGDARGARLVETGARYQMWHALAMLACLAARRASAPALPCALALGLWAAGAVLFPASLYALALGGPPALGVVTPVGGAAFLLGWAALARTALTTARR